MRVHIVEHMAMPLVYTVYTNLYKTHQWGPGDWRGGCLRVSVIYFRWVSGGLPCLSSGSSLKHKIYPDRYGGVPPEMGHRNLLDIFNRNINHQH